MSLLLGSPRLALMSFFRQSLYRSGTGGRYLVESWNESLRAEGTLDSTMTLFTSDFGAYYILYRSVSLSVIR